MSNSSMSLAEQLTTPRQHPRAQRLLIVARLQQSQLQQALKRCGELQQRLQQEQQQCQQLQQYRDEYQSQLAQPDSRAVSAGLLHHTVYFIQQINQSLVQQQQRIKEVEEQVRLAKEHSAKCQAKAQGLVDMMDNLERQWQKQQDRQEQRQIDEWSNQQHHSKLSNS